jgi:GNAT superfamily N-acetyltransferase
MTLIEQTVSNSESPALLIRQAQASDLGTILRFVRELAAYEKLADKVVVKEQDLSEHLFGNNRKAEALIANWGPDPVGFALFFHNFSTFLGRPGIYLEDLYVTPELRGRGIGRALLVSLARLARERNCGRLEWAVLDWNEPAINFYKKMGAVPLGGWTVFRLSGASLESMALEKTSEEVSNVSQKS